ncbi:hypothetical protein KJ940_14170, partial [Myxococcota bacterium]|nr:hypothetical protein [Myxococcota bacterium]
MRGHLPRDRRLRLHVSALLLCLGQLIGCAAPRPRDDPAARAAWRAAQATEGEARVEALKALAVRWPDDLFAEQALGALSREARDPAALVPWLEARAAAPRQSAPMALYCVAWIHRHARGDAEAALAALARFTWPTHTLYDDALWMEAGLRAERGEGEAARAALRRIVEG